MPIIIFLSALLNLSIGFLVIFRSRQYLNLTFSLLCFLLAIVGFVDFFFRYNTSFEIVKWAYAFGSLIPGLALIWVNELVERRASKISSFFILVPAIIFFVLSLKQGIIIKDVDSLSRFGFVGIGGSLFFLYGLYIFTYTSIAVVKLMIARDDFSRTKRLRISFSLLGLIIYGSIAFLVSFFLPSIMGIYRYTAFDSPSSVIFIGFSVYAMYKYRLFGIRFMASVVFNYFVLFFFLCFCVIIYIFLLKFFVVSYPEVQIFFSLFCGIIFLSLIISLNDYLRKKDNILFYQGKKPSIVLGAVIDKIKNELHVDKIKEIVFEEFSNVLDGAETKAWLYQGKTYSHNTGIGREIVSEIKKELNVKDGFIVTEELAESYKLKNKLEEKNIKIISLLKKGDKQVGFLAVGPKKSLDPYNYEEIRFIQKISPHVASSFLNSFKYEELEHQNYNLKESQKEFLGVVANRLKIPIYKLHGVIRLAKRDDGDHEKIKRYIDSSFSRLNRIKKVVDKIVVASEVDGDLLDFELVPINLDKVLFELIDLNQGLAKNKNVNLNYENNFNKDIKIFSNRAYLDKAIDSLIDNAILFSLGGDVDISVKIEAKKAQIFISDTGIGIPEEDKKKIFKKFGKANNFKMAHEDGLGLGLYVAKGIINYHENGKLSLLESELGKGSKFLIELPLFLG